LDKRETRADEEKACYSEGSPTELIDLTLELDATDQLEEPEKHPEIVRYGLHPSLAMLESMMQSQSLKGENEKSPLVLFIWGPMRIKPVRLTSLRISEETFDPKLNPIRVKVDICMRVVEGSELKKGTAAYNLYVNNLSRKNSFASMYRKHSVVRNYIKKTRSDVRRSLSVKKPTLRKSTNVKYRRPRHPIRLRKQLKPNTR
jgi:U3 small nucleolar ribonucleoprotein component